ncbi:MAG: HD domain-containing protein [Patescibacteria group bacterium]|jgi:5'-deoxynucleotidase YfbR-like HD superfamily hydrolase
MLDTRVLVDDLLRLTREYAATYRAIVTEERHAHLVKTGILKEYTYDTEAIREPLLEHVGHLPVIASYLHQHIEHAEEVDLGRVLIMLSVHDIGETKVGDIMTYKKPDSHALLEAEAARKLLPEYLYQYFEEVEKAETLDGKFAKSIDSLAPLLHELTMPTVTQERFASYHFNIEDIVAKKTPHFAWDSVLQELFAYIIGQYRGWE